jgi:hypothetical protein
VSCLSNPNDGAYNPRRSGSAINVGSRDGHLDFARDEHTFEKTPRTSCGRTPQPRLCLAYVISLILSDSRNTNDPSTCPEYQGASLYIAGQVHPLAHSRKSQSGKDSIEISVRQFALILSRQKRSASRTLDDLCDVLLYYFIS